MYIATVFSNKYVQAALVFVLIVGGYILYKNVMYNIELSQRPAEQTTVEETNDAMVSMEGMESMEGMSAEDSGEMDLSGIHIMANGDVMLGNGAVLDDATILEDGTIQLGTGVTVTPVMDMRR